MKIIIKKGVGRLVFPTKFGKIKLEGEGLINTLTDEQYDSLMAEYGKFIEKRLASDKNPSGCFVIREKVQVAKEESKDFDPAFSDNSAPVEVEAIPEEKEPKAEEIKGKGRGKKKDK